MSILATIALAASSASLPACSWDRPGVNPFMGDVVAAVDRYKDIPAAVRSKLKTRMQARSYDEIVSISRDAIKGEATYGAEIRDMHFGAGSVCRTVTRSKWTAQSMERGLVYCEDGHCILVPTVCRNVSRITRTAPKPQVAPAASRNLAAASGEAEPELIFEPPGAGAPAEAAAPAAPGSFAALSVPAATPTAVPVGSSNLGGGAPAPMPGVGTPSLPPGTLEPQELTPLPAPLPAVPEPHSWALLLAGLAAVTAIARRRRRAG